MRAPGIEGGGERVDALLYWHMGATRMRFFKVSPRIFSGVKRVGSGCAPEARGRGVPGAFA